MDHRHPFSVEYTSFGWEFTGCVQQQKDASGLHGPGFPGSQAAISRRTHRLELPYKYRTWTPSKIGAPSGVYPDLEIDPGKFRKNAQCTICDSPCYFAQFEPKLRTWVTCHAPAPAPKWSKNGPKFEGGVWKPRGSLDPSKMVKYRCEMGDFGGQTRSTFILRGK